MKAVLNDRHEIFKPYSSQCGRCKHLDWGKFTCCAFPSGIPDKLLSGESEHNEPFPGQEGDCIFEEESI